MSKLVNKIKIDEKKLQSTVRSMSIHTKIHAYSQITRLLLILGISANQTTLLSCLFGLLGSYLILTPYYLLSAPILYLYIVLDYSDGWVARYNGTASDFGDVLDHVNHVIVITSMLVASSIVSGQYYMGVMTILFFWITVISPYKETGMLGSSYGKIRFVGVQILPEIGMFLGIITNKLEILIYAHLILYGIVFVLITIKNLR